MKTIWILLCMVALAIGLLYFGKILSEQGGSMVLCFHKTQICEEVKKVDINFSSSNLECYTFHNSRTVCRGEFVSYDTDILRKELLESCRSRNGIFSGWNRCSTKKGDYQFDLFEKKWEQVP